MFVRNPDGFMMSSVIQGLIVCLACFILKRVREREILLARGLKNKELWHFNASH